MATQPCLDLVRPVIHEMLKPFTADGAVEQCRERVKTFPKLLDLINGAGLEGTLRLHLGWNVDEPHRQTGGDFLTGLGQKSSHCRLTGRDAEDPKTLHRTKAKILGASQFRAAIRQHIDRRADHLRLAFAYLIERPTDVRP